VYKQKWPFRIFFQFNWNAVHVFIFLAFLVIQFFWTYHWIFAGSVQMFKIKNLKQWRE
jgi:hypothetical protein